MVAERSCRGCAVNVRLLRLVGAFLIAVAFAGCDDGALDADAGDGLDAGGAPDAELTADASLEPDASSVSRALHIIVEPSDMGAGLLAAISGARSSVHMTMYLLTSNEIIDALVAQHAAGLDVRVVLNESFAPGATTNNDAAFATLSAAGVPVRWSSSRYNLTHEKCVILDASEAWIMTMNASFSSPTRNREYLVVDDEPADVRDAEAVFEADFAGMDFPSYGGALVLAPINAQDRIIALIASARRTVDVEDEELSDTRTVTALVDAAGRGVAVRVVLSDSTPTSAGGMAIALLRGAGIAVVAVSVPFIHAKAIVVDGLLAFVGSENLTRASLTMNRELGVMTDSAAAVSVVASTIDTDFAAGTSL